MNISSLMKDKKGLIMGVANDRSIAWAIAKTLHKSGAQVALAYQGEALKKRVYPLADEIKSPLILECNVEDEKDIIKMFKEIKKKWKSIDFIVHAIAFSNREELKGKYLNTSKENFKKTLDVSCYSFTSVAREASKIMNNGGSLLTLSYFGSEKFMPHYNVMGIAKSALEASIKYLAKDLGKKKIRVNALSPGPIKTLAASAIGDFSYILKWNENNSPLKRNITLDDISGSAIYLLSDLSSGVTGEIHHVDSGYNIIGMKDTDSPDIFEKK
ncbi:MAG: Enoyl-[acyl-carrier-protein] reductase [NADH] FabI [Alphaproteobacteria bacterium MarineAlpha6_Bin6]|nr:enoyl-[acyl-carrier-protein] reductase FabI [Pelagibacteraceae bacterium]PPR31656.1 MAG: Enoyl-[acyl-carrier-protein] reductase [NADH] FabI [Alphaproteobacteria bacterium MarineAlpha6_Bin6]PPR33210.1 MAG: Enoyl-[acyl-carrier-protein] reductase [NADH] FabI [Alphaproteobacteria bacterium MarineAlpha6_Bin5]|tara:strand:+ start:146 stop:958 length:813 start_codon:yes stop_codon:yes gene_type:complete